MTVVTTLPWGRPLTRADLETMPDDGHRRELVDGTLLVSPAPSIRHQHVVRALLVILDEARPPHLTALCAPVDVVLSDRTVLQPDVLLARRDDLTDTHLPAPPVLAVEVLSPSSRAVDRLLKYDRYAEAGVEHYWIVDPDEPSLTAYRLSSDGSYAQIAQVTADQPFEATDPVHAVIIPSELVQP